MSDDDISGLAAELSYRYFLAFVPFLIFMTALGALIASLLPIDRPTEQIMDRIEPNLPASAAGVIREQLDNLLDSPNASILSVTFLAAIFSASSATKTMIKAVARIYGQEDERPFWRKQLVSIGLVVFGGGFLLLGIVAIVMSQWYIGWVLDAIGLGAFVGFVLQTASFVLVLAGFVLAISVLHRIGSNHVRTFRQIAPGAAISAIVWVIATYLFGLYVANFGSYGNTYGALGGIIVLLVWFYLSNYVLLLGAELNDVLSRR